MFFKFHIDARSLNKELKYLMDNSLSVIWYFGLYIKANEDKKKKKQQNNGKGEI